MNIIIQRWQFWGLRGIGVFVLLFSGCCILHAQTEKCDSTRILFAKIDFQEHFKGDTVSFKVNGYRVFDSVATTSHPIVDFTGVDVMLFKHDNEVLELLYSHKRKVLRWKEPMLYFEITVNRHNSSFYVDCTKGKAIGIYKIGGDSVLFRQYDRWFAYE